MNRPNGARQLNVSFATQQDNIGFIEADTVLTDSLPKSRIVFIMDQIIKQPIKCMQFKGCWISYKQTIH